MSSHNSNNERRQHPRAPGPVPVEVQIADFTGEVEATNYGAGGLYLDVEAIPSASCEAIEEGDIVAVTLPAINERSSRLLRGTVVRLDGNGVGVRFIRANDSIQAHFDELTGNTSAAAEPPSAVVGGGDEVSGDLKRELLAFARDRAREYVHTHMLRWKDDFSDQLLIEASRTQNTVLQSMYFEAMSLVGAHAKDLPDALADGIAARFTDFPSVPEIDDLAQLDSRELQVVEDDALEHWLALTELVSSSDARFTRSLAALQHRLGTVAGEKLSADNNPISPLVLVRSFDDHVGDWPIAHVGKQLALQRFGSVVMADIGRLYRDINERFEADGFKFVPPTPQSKPKAVASASEQVAEVEDKGTSRQATAAGHYALASTLQALRGHDAAASTQMTATLQQTMPLAQEQVQGLLRRVEVNDWYRQDAGRWLREKAESERPLDASQAMQVEVGGQMMGALLADQLLPERNRGWLETLAPAFAESLIRNPAIFDDARHPLRRIINQLGTTHVGSSTQPANRKIARQVDEIVAQLAGSTGMDDEAWDRASNEINALIRRQQNVRQVQVRRLVERLEGRDRLKRARREVAVMVNQALGEDQAPAAIVDMLEAGWRQLMVIDNLREGVDSEALQRRLDLMVEIRDWLTGRKVMEFKTVQGRIDGILSELEVLGGSPERRAALSSHFKDVLSAIAVKRPMPESPLQAVDDVEAPAEFAADDHWSGRARLLQPGARLQQLAEEEPKSALELAWRARDASQFAAVDDDGQLAAEWELRELADDLRDRRLDILADRRTDLADRTRSALIDRLHAEAADLASHDPLTGVLNRRTLIFELQRALSAAQHDSEESATLVKIDVDRFSSVNARLGTESADEVLARVARAVASELPASAVLGRVVDDHFVALLDHGADDAPELADLCERIVATVRAAPMGDAPGDERVTVRVAARAVSQDDTEIDQVLAPLDEVLAELKREGGDAWRIDEGEKDVTGAADQRKWARRLASKSLRDRLVLHGQVIKPLTLGLSPLVEVLVRYRDHSGGIVSPESFLPAAESFGNVLALDLTVLEQTLALISLGLEKWEGLGAVSLNLSGFSLGQRRFRERLPELLDDYAIPGQRLIFEVTETTAIANLGVTARFLDEMRERSIRIALDDFGSGLASYAYLKQLPVDFLKIDGEFVRGIGENAMDFALVKSIHEVGKSLGKLTVAEHVESAAAFERAQEIGLDYVQGYHLGHPGPLADVLREADNLG